MKRWLMWSIAASLILIPMTAEAGRFWNRRHAVAVVVTPLDAQKSAKVHVDVYKDKAGEWRWRAVHQNKNVMADSGEGYKRVKSAVDAIRTLFGDKFPVKIEGAKSVSNDAKAELWGLITQPDGRMLYVKGQPTEKAAAAEMKRAKAAAGITEELPAPRSK